MQSANTRVNESREKLSAMAVDRIDRMCKILLAELGEGITQHERVALDYLRNHNYDSAKEMCLSDPCSPFLAAISCIASAYRSPMVADSVLRDAARHTTESVKKKSEKRIADSFSAIVLDNLG